MKIQLKHTLFALTAVALPVFAAGFQPSSAPQEGFNSVANVTSVAALKGHLGGFGRQNCASN